MKIAIIGPTHPYKGGIAKHTTELAHQLEQAGHEVVLLSWKHQYPFFYPGQQFVPDNHPEVPVFANTKRVLSWRNPLGWWVQARHLRNFDQIIFVWWVPTIQGPVYSLMLRAVGKQPVTTILCHNVMRHEAQATDRLVVSHVLKRATQVLVHSLSQAELARSLGAKEVIQAALPPVLPPRKNEEPVAKVELRRHLLFFGLVREYKGLDILLQALKLVPGVRLTVAGEVWESEKYDALITDLGLSDRVSMLNRYTPDNQLEDLFQDCDALVLPYRGGTGTFNVAYAHYFHRPVIATTAGTLANEVKDKVDGLLCAPEDPASLAAAIKHFYKAGVAESLQKGIANVNTAEPWAKYVKAITSGK
jgi:glycosyltransferase involved in cell wall biosynthesis